MRQAHYLGRPASARAQPVVVRHAGCRIDGFGAGKIGLQQGFGSGGKLDMQLFVMLHNKPVGKLVQPLVMLHNRPVGKPVQLLFMLHNRPVGKLVQLLFMLHNRPVGKLVQLSIKC